MGRLRGIAALAAIAALGACTSTAPATASPGATAASSPGSSAAATAPATAPALTPLPSATCAPFAGPVTPPSDRLTAVTLTDSGYGHIVAFVFGTASGGVATPSGSVSVAQPPFLRAGSGAAVTVAGERFLKVTFRGLTLMDAAGAPTLAGSLDIAGRGAVAEIVNIDQSEGVSTWIVGLHGTGCVTVSSLAATEIDVLVP